MLPKAHLTSHSRCLALDVWSHHCGYLAHEDLFLYSSSVYSCHFLISSASVRSVSSVLYEDYFCMKCSLCISHFLEEISAVAAAAASLQSCLTLCDSVDGSPPGSAIPGILQARTLEWVAICFSNAWKWKVKVKLLSRVLLCDPIDGSPPGSSVPGILQARTLE